MPQESVSSKSLVPSTSNSMRRLVLVNVNQVSQEWGQHAFQDVPSIKFGLMVSVNARMELQKLTLFVELVHLDPIQMLQKIIVFALHQGLSLIPRLAHASALQIVNPMLHVMLLECVSAIMGSMLLVILACLSLAVLPTQFGIKPCYLVYVPTLISI